MPIINLKILEKNGLIAAVVFAKQLTKLFIFNAQKTKLLNSSKRIYSRKSKRN